MNIEKILRHSGFFRDIGSANISALAEICIPRRIEKKQTLFLEGQRGHSMYLLVYGTVQLFKSTPDGRDIVIRVIGPGELFAEVILVEEEVYPVSAVGLEESLVLMIPKRQIHCLLANERFRTDFIRMLMKKQRHLTERIRNLTLHDVEERFFIFLKQQYGTAYSYMVSLSKKDIAAAIWTNPETLSRLIHRLKQEKTISWNDKTLTLRQGFWDNWPVDEG
jgi:CRP/FNR family transcriptional regulator